jgi:hypothetical protein
MATVFLDCHGRFLNRYPAKSRGNAKTRNACELKKNYFLFLLLVSSFLLFQLYTYTNMPARKATPSSATKQKSKAVTKTPVEKPIAAKEKPVKEKPIVTVTEDSSPGIKSGKNKVVLPKTDAFYRGNPSLILDFSQLGSVFQHVSPLLSFITHVNREIGECFIKK